MKKIVWLLMMVVMPMVANAAFSRNADLEDEDELLHRLDQYIARRDEFSSKKEKKLIRMKKKLNLTSGKRERLSLYNQIYREYYTYRYDSAMVYAKRGLQLAEQLHDDYYINLNKINRAAVLSTGGFYSQAEDLLLSLKPEDISPKLMQYYYYTLTWVYNYWGAFCERSEFKEEMQDKKKLYLAKTLEYMGNKQSALYYYLNGELEYLQHRTDKKVLGWYQKALAASPVDSRVHASAAYCIARYYQDNEQMDIYEKYLVQAAISDQVCPLKENLALQELSTYLYNKDAKYAKRVSKYIYCSMEDAQFYNNRLRMVEISRILPLITETNHQREIRQNRIITISLVVVSIVFLGFLAMMFFVFRINKRLAKSRREVRSQNMLLEELNQKLLNTNKHRETYMRLFMDISAVYIKKLDDYRKLVSRKIRAKQTADLLTAINSYKLAEEEASSFYIRFDKAFMDLYPNFVDEFNQLLLPEKQIVLPAPNSLTKELRIYALMRLGITDGQELATLLFYSTQTIYNYKTSIRKRAKDLTTFDAAINQLCNVIG
ncbi:hypothetical protein F7D20_00660 [Prevotella copri]|uniref:DUF6377 domain-containing protein n=1 Tax=Segatella copri TaxID=165179 RepID=A0A6A7W7R7_9BACT|nr:DUF6377 domain-containing protein [Segatella copri]MQP10507.1 hypothetical protein [Segatella copri]